MNARVQRINMHSSFFKQNLMKRQASLLKVVVIASIIYNQLSLFMSKIIDGRLRFF